MYPNSYPAHNICFYAAKAALIMKIHSHPLAKADGNRKLFLLSLAIAYVYIFIAVGFSQRNPAIESYCYYPWLLHKYICPLPLALANGSRINAPTNGFSHIFS